MVYCIPLVSIIYPKSSVVCSIPEICALARYLQAQVLDQTTLGTVDLRQQFMCALFQMLPEKLQASVH
jgi:hypothetical protein